MILIIDGYNLLFHECWPYPDGLLENRRKQLIQEVVAYKNRQQLARTIIVFDGCAGIGPYKQIITNNGVEIIYAICQGRADEKIISLSHRLNNVSVVTADRRVIKYTKRNKSKIIYPEAFGKKLFQRTQESTRETNFVSNDIDEWLEEFGLDEEVEIYLKKKRCIA